MTRWCIPKPVRARRATGVLLAVVAIGVGCLPTPSTATASTVEYSYTGHEQTYMVGLGVTSVHVVAIGARGGSVPWGGAGVVPGGLPEKVTADLPVSAGETLYVEVGGSGAERGLLTAPGWNGGGAGGEDVNELNGGGGGGASDVRTVPMSKEPESLASRAIVAAGGGGAGGVYGGNANGSCSAQACSGETGGSGFFPKGGQGATSTVGGFGGAGCREGSGAQPGQQGTLGVGGRGGSAVGGEHAPEQQGGGGGGGGYNGGGGGGGLSMGCSISGSEGDRSGGGGGGASYVGSEARNASFELGSASTPLVTITTEAPPVCAAVQVTAPANGAAASVSLSCTGNPLSYSVLASPTHGTLGAIDQANGQVTYTPQSGYVGQDTFTYEATSSGGSSAPATVTITVPQPQLLPVSSLSPGSTSPVSPIGSPPHETAPRPRVEARMTWTFGWTRRYTIVKKLAVHDVPAGASVEVSCRGGHCPRAHEQPATGGSCKAHGCKVRGSRSTLSLAHLFKGRHLGVGAQISVDIVKSGWIGKSFLFTTRANAEPALRIGCLAPASTKPTPDC
ncbi:MAG TPA: Ig-like domain-containing protein [Solirubrobacteraceae bacterium]|jgi:hypothetical protein|nr:Ig-like domain-containing protein [Solirubrobacteraceae bacterium]